MEFWEPLGVDCDDPDEPFVGGGGLELVDVLEVVGGGEPRVGTGVLTDGTLTDGVLTDGTVTDGVLTDGVLTEGTGNDDAAGGSAIAVIAPTIPAPTDATSNFPRLDTSDLPCRVRSSKNALSRSWTRV